MQYKRGSENNVTKTVLLYFVIKFNKTMVNYVDWRGLFHAFINVSILGQATDYTTFFPVLRNL